MFRNIRSLLSYSRVPVRLAAQQEKHKLYRVRFVPQERRLNAFLRAFLIVSGMQVAANTMLQIFGGEWEEPLFIPLGFSQAEPLKRYEASDPDFQAFVRFNQDKKKVSAARAKVLETLVKHLEKNNESKFGGNVKAEASILYYHYPIAPPQEYTRKGLQISPAPRDQATPSGILHPLRLSNLKYEWVTRPVPQSTKHHLNTTLYPSWVFYSLYSSIIDTFAWLQALKASGQPMDTMGDLVAVGGTAVKKGLSDTRAKLRSTWRPPPPPKGHVIIDGIVQIGGNNMIVGIDVTASFDPETLGEWRFHRTEVRFAGKVKPRRKQAPGPLKDVLDDEGMEAVVKAAKEAVRAAEEMHRKSIEAQKGFMEKKAKEGQKGGIEQSKVGREGPEDVKPSVQILGEKREESIPDPSPRQDVSKRTGSEKQKADVDDASSKP